MSVRLGVVIVAAVALGVPSGASALDAPTLGKNVNVRPVKGTVFVGGKRLRRPRQIAVGTVVNATNGTVRLTSARDTAAHLQSGRFSGGRFRVRQSDDPSAHGLTVLRLRGSAKAFKTCSGDRTIRKLRANVDGRFRTVGRYSSATVRGTKWLMNDTCSGTLTVVATGTVIVDDFGSGKRTIVRAGERYFAPKR